MHPSHAMKEVSFSNFLFTSLFRFATKVFRFENAILKFIKGNCDCKILRNSLRYLKRIIEKKLDIKCLILDSFEKFSAKDFFFLPFFTFLKINA